MELTIHNDIMDRLHHFHKVGKIPNIIFHGNYACGKKYLLYNFIDLIYNNDKSLINKYVISVNCAQGKGIKFVREELKFFARTNMDNMDGNTFKTTGYISQNARDSFILMSPIEKLAFLESFAFNDTNLTEIKMDF